MFWWHCTPPTQDTNPKHTSRFVDTVKSIFTQHVPTQICSLNKCIIQSVPCVRYPDLSHTIYFGGRITIWFYIEVSIVIFPVECFRVLWIAFLHGVAPNDGRSPKLLCPTGKPSPDFTFAQFQNGGEDGDQTGCCCSRSQIVGHILFLVLEGRSWRTWAWQYEYAEIPSISEGGQFPASILFAGGMCVNPNTLLYLLVAPLNTFYGEFCQTLKSLFYPFPCDDSSSCCA